MRGRGWSGRLWPRSFADVVSPWRPDPVYESDAGSQPSGPLNGARARGPDFPTRPWLLRTTAPATVCPLIVGAIDARREDEPLFAERVAGLDIAKAEVEVTIRVPSDTTPGRRQQETRTFGTTRRELLALADWLRCWGVTKIGMEATGDYWKPVFFLLESRGFDCDLYNAAQVKALPGRPKTDRADSIWLARIIERGMISSSFVPPEPIRRLAPTPATGVTSPRRAPPRSSGRRNCWKTGT